jgi:RNA-binding protein YhbY
MNTPRMKEAWEKYSRTADGFYSTTTPMSVYAGSCYEEGCKLERELAEAREEIDQLKSQLTKTHGCVTISRNGYVQEIERELANIKDQRDVAVWVFEKCREDRTRVVAQRDRLADALGKAVERQGFSNDELIAAREIIAAMSKTTPIPTCPRCGGKGHYFYDHNHSKPCEQCCTHIDGWWDLTEHHAGYIAEADNGCCRIGCGQLRRELNSENAQDDSRDLSR